MFMVSELTPRTAGKASEEQLIAVLNECRPDSGAWIVAKNEITFRAMHKSHVWKVVYGVLGALATLLIQRLFVK
jgi:hypothetical protein